MSFFSRKQVIGTVAYLGGIPAVPEPFCWSWAQMIEFNNEYLCAQNETIHYSRTLNSFHSHARNEIVNHMYGEWLLMLDCDHAFEPDLVLRMLRVLNTYQIDVLCGVYMYKKEPYPPVLYQDNPLYKEGISHKSTMFAMVVDFDPTVHLYEIGSAGTGCLLVRRNIYDRIFDELGEMPFDIIHPHSEDHSFFRRLKKLGIKAFFSPQIECNHLMWKRLSLKDYDNSACEFLPVIESNGLVSIQPKERAQ